MPLLSLSWRRGKCGGNEVFAPAPKEMRTIDGSILHYSRVKRLVSDGKRVLRVSGSNGQLFERSKSRKQKLEPSSIDQITNYDLITHSNLTLSNSP
jgi:hypothetical protein